MKSKLDTRVLLTLIIAIILAALSGCDFINPTKVTNPQITDDALRANATGGAAALISGLKRQYSDAHRQAHIIDVVSDNYFNTLSFISNNLDRPSTVSPLDLTLPSVYNAFQTMNALADFGLGTVIPNDETATDDQKAEAHFYKGMALVLLSENFSAFPVIENGQAMASRQATALAIDEFKTAFNLASEASIRINCKLALARAYRLAGDKANAAIEAQAALALPGGADYVLLAPTDAAQLPNLPFTRIISGNDLQPLPRLDFLDPKYIAANSSIPSLKAEEAHLILAEVALVNGDLAGARAAMVDAVNLSRSRPVTTTRDRDPRSNRPNDPTFSVKASPSAPAVAGLIQRRGGSGGTTITVYPISGTSVTVDAVNALLSSAEHYHMLYQLRQEIFFLEGRRMSDLGIRLPVSDRQIQTNPNIAAGDAGTVVIVPSYIPAAGSQLDQFTVDAANKLVIITHDMNQLIAENIQQVSPFLTH